MDVRHDEDKHRFYVDLDGGKAVLTYRTVESDLLDFTHTFVPPEHRNGGIGEALVLEGLERARKSGQQVIPTCPFVEAVAERHPEYDDVVVQEG